MSKEGVPDPAEMASFVEQFVVAVDFQNPVPVAGDTKLADLPEWDSLAALGVIVMCDTDYGVTITGNDLKVCATVGDILARVRAKKAS
jgi:acyl carrier protein